MDHAAESGNEIALSAVSLAEIIYLIEKRRIPPNLYSDLRIALSDPDCVLMEVPLRSAIVDAMSSVPRAEVPDMPDRIRCHLCCRRTAHRRKAGVHSRWEVLPVRGQRLWRRQLAKVRYRS